MSISLQLRAESASWMPGQVLDVDNSGAINSVKFRLSIKELVPHVFRTTHGVQCHANTQTIFLIIKKGKYFALGVS